VHCTLCRRGLSATAPCYQPLSMVRNSSQLTSNQRHIYLEHRGASSNPFIQWRSYQAEEPTLKPITKSTMCFVNLLNNCSKLQPLLLHTSLLGAGGILASESRCWSFERLLSKLWSFVLIRFSKHRLLSTRHDLEETFVADIFVKPSPHE